MTQSTWFYEVLGEEFGPVSTDDIRKLLDDGTLDVSDRIRAADAREWTTISAWQPTDEPAELSDLSELSFSFEESAEQSPEPDGTDIAHPDINEFNLQGDSESPRPVVRRPVIAQEEEEDSSEPAYYVQSMGEQLGPMSLRELIAMADVGTLSPEDTVREGGDAADWVPATEVPELAASFIAATATLGVAGRRKSQRRPKDADSPADGKGKSDQADGSPAGEKAETSAAARGATDSSAQKKSGGETTSKAKRRRKRKNAAEEDETLKEIFAEVFTPDGKLRKDQAAEETPQPAAAATAVQISDTSPERPAEAAAAGGVTQAATSQPEPSPSAAMATAASAAASPGQPGFSSTPQSRPQLPPHLMGKKKKKGAGFSFNMPDPKVMGIAAAAIVGVGLLIALATGMVSVPGFAPDAKSVAEKFLEEYNRRGGDNISEKDWEELRKETLDAVVAVNKALASSNLTPESMKTRQVMSKLGVFVSRPYKDKKARQEALEDLKAAMQQI